MKEMWGTIISKAHKVGGQTVETTCAILRAVFSMLKQVLKWITTGVLAAGIIIGDILCYLICWIFIITCGVVVVGIPLGGIGYLIYWTVRAEQHR